MRDLTLFFIRNVTNGTWIGSPLTGAEECEWPEAFAFVSAGDALSVMDQLVRRARAEAFTLSRRVVGFVTRRPPEADEFAIVPLSLDEPDPDAEGGEGEDDGYVDAVGEVHELPEEGREPEDDEDGPIEERLERGIAWVAAQRVKDVARRTRSPWVGSWPEIWTRTPIALPGARRDAA